MSNKKRSMPTNVLSTLALTGMLLGVPVTSAMAAQGDFYDTTAMLHYPGTGLTGDVKADLISAAAANHSFIKEQAGSTFLDYTAAYARLGLLLDSGKTGPEAILEIAADATLHPTIDTSEFTDANADEELTVASVSAINATVTIDFNKAIGTITKANFLLSKGTVANVEKIADDIVKLSVTGIAAGETFSVTVQNIPYGTNSVLATYTEDSVIMQASEQTELELTASASEIKADGIAKITLTATLPEDTVGVVQFQSTLPSLSKNDVILENGKAIIDFKPITVSSSTEVTIQVQVKNADNAELVGKSDEIKITVLPVTDNDIPVEIKQITAVNAEQADRITLYTNTDDFDIADLDPADFTVLNRRYLNEGIEIIGFQKHPINPRAIIAYLDVDNDPDAVEAFEFDSMTDNARHVLVINQNDIFAANDIEFDLVDANHPTLLDVTTDDQLTVIARFSESVYRQMDQKPEFSASNPANYLIDGVRVSEIQGATVEVGTVTVAGGIVENDARHLVTIKLPIRNALTNGNHSLQVFNIGDWAVRTDDRNVLTTQTKEFTVNADTNAPVATLAKKWTEQFVVTFNKALVDDPTFSILNAQAVAGKGDDQLELKENNAGLADVADLADAGFSVTPLTRAQARVYDDNAVLGYLIELNEDWTQEVNYDTAASGVNYWSSQVNPYTLVVKDIEDLLGNKVAKQDILFSLPRDIENPKILSVDEIAGLDYTEKVLAEQEWNVKASEPLQVFSNGTPAVSTISVPLTPSQEQELIVDAGLVPEIEVEFSKGDVQIPGNVIVVANDDLNFNIQPAEALEAGTWTVTLKALTDDVGNAIPTQQFTVTIKAEVGPDSNPAIVWADAHYADWYTGIVGNDEETDTIHVKFNKKMSTLGTESVLREANWTVDGYELPIGTSIEKGIAFISGESDSITIKLPEGWLENNTDGDIVVDFRTLLDTESKELDSGRIILEAWTDGAHSDINHINDQLDIEYIDEDFIGVNISGVDLTSGDLDSPSLNHMPAGNLVQDKDYDEDDLSIKLGNLVGDITVTGDNVDLFDGEVDDVIIQAPDDESITVNLTDMVINGNLTVDAGDNGDVILDNVTVTGNVVIENVGANSFEANDLVVDGSLIFNDDDGHVVLSGDGTDIDNLDIGEGAGGEITFDDLESGAIDSLTGDPDSLDFTDSDGEELTDEDLGEIITPVTPGAPQVTCDDTANTVTGMAAGMEYSLDGAAYVAYSAAVFNALDFSGNHTLLVRVAAEGINPAGPATTLTFTTNEVNVAPSILGASGEVGGRQVVADSNEDNTIWTIDLSQNADSDMFTGFTVTASPDAETATMTVILNGTQTTFDVDFDDDGLAVVNVADVLGALDPQGDGVSIEQIKAIGLTTFTAVVEDAEGLSTTVTINLVVQ